jgi:hypothetical protein
VRAAAEAVLFVRGLILVPAAVGIIRGRGVGSPVERNIDGSRRRCSGTFESHAAYLVVGAEILRQGDVGAGEEQEEDGRPAHEASVSLPDRD